MLLTGDESPKCHTVTPQGIGILKADQPGSRERPQPYGRNIGRYGCAYRGT